MRITSEDKQILRSLRGNDEYKAVFKIFDRACENLKEELLQCNLRKDSFADVSIALSKYQAVKDTITKVKRQIDSYASINDQ